MSNLSFDKFRPIPNAFFDSGTDPDGTDGEGPFIECNKVHGGSMGVKAPCRGITIGSTSGAATVATIKMRLRGGSAVDDFILTLNEVHRFDIEKLYGNNGDANDVRILY
jgi:hypothetical protein